MEDRKTWKEIPDHEDGMTLLDYFAGQYMQAVVSRQRVAEEDRDEMAIDCYRVAFQMIYARDDFIDEFKG